MPLRNINLIKAAIYPSVVPAIGIAALSTVVAACTYMTWNTYRQVGLRAREAAETVVQPLERDIGRNIEVLELAATGYGRSRKPGGDAGGPIIAEDDLFDRSSSKGVGCIDRLRQKIRRRRRQAAATRPAVRPKPLAYR